MQLKIYNCPDKDFKPFVADAARFFAEKLILNKRVLKNCHIKIRFTDKIKEYGYASVDEKHKGKKPRKFLIEIHPGIGARRILETLAHEMVHIKQYVTGELSDNMSAWYGIKIDSDKIDYWDHPWEIDAFGRENGLLYKYAVSHALWDIFDEFRNPDLPIVSTPIKWKKT